MTTTDIGTRDEMLGLTRLDEAPFKSDGICLDENYLHALREAAYDWGIEDMAGEPVVARRAAIWFGRNIVTLIDEVRRLRG